MDRLTLIATNATRTPIAIPTFTLQEVDEQEQLLVVTAPEQVFADTGLEDTLGTEVGYSVVVTTAGTTYHGFIEDVEAAGAERTYTCGFRGG